MNDCQNLEVYMTLPASGLHDLFNLYYENMKIRSWLVAY